MQSHNRLRRRGLLLALGLASSGALLRAIAQPVQPGAEGTALRYRSPERYSMLSAGSLAGKRAVVVGEQGLVLLSDDSGGTWKQAAHVPTQASLNALTFIDDRHGWAAGHDGAILHTRDGGQNWVLQRSDLTVDRPIFGIHFFDEKHGIAVGLWSLLLRTDDGGQTWREMPLPMIPGQAKQDRNLLAIFGKGAAVHITSEGGDVLTSRDRGNSWVRTATGYDGSLWSGAILHDGTIVVAGMAGNVLRSVDGGLTWVQVPTGTKSSITGVTPWREGAVAVGLDGAVLSSHDSATAFTTVHRTDRAALTNVFLVDDRPLALSKRGFVSGIVS